MDSISLKSNYTNFKDKPFRKHQAEAIESILESDKKFTVLDAPTGCGKSLIGCCVAQNYNNATYLVHSIALQEQIERDFPEFVLLKGRNNYKCQRNTNNTCAECSAVDKDDKCAYCPYEIQKRKTLASPYKILNYHYFITESNHVGRFQGDELYILDEAEPQMLELLFGQFISLTISENMLKTHRIPPPRFRTTSSDKSIPEWKEWADGVLKRVLSDLTNLEQEKDMWDSVEYDWQREHIKKIDKLNTLVWKLRFFIQYVDRDWIQNHRKTQYGDYYIFEPVWLTKEIMQEYLWKYMPGKVLLMSATFPPQRVTAQLLGINNTDMDYVQVPNIFPVANKKIYIDVAGDLRLKNFDNDIVKIVKKIDEIVDMYPNDKGLIHTTSNKLRDAIISCYSEERYITHNTKDRGSVIQRFKESNKPLVMVSPSLERGVSFDDDMCRFIIIAKSPFLSLGDKKVSARYHTKSIGRYWYLADCASTMIQMTGRGVRNDKDYCDIYIIEQSAKDLIVKNVGLFPKHWRESIV